MIALARMRLAAFARTGRSLAPLLAGLVVLATLYGGGRAAAGEAYGVSAVVLFPVLAWQSKLLLDTEPDVQRRLARVAIGAPWRELAAGLLAALLVGLVTIGLALALPWLIGGVEGSVAAGLALGLWAHALALPPAILLGALASRVVTRTAAYGVAVLASGAVGALVLGIKSSPVPWLVPPIMPTARRLADTLTATDVTLLTTQALTWTAIALLGYARLRRTRP